MHRDSEDSEAETAALRLYMDESGGSDPGTPHATVGGMLIYRKAFLPFEEEWDAMLARYGIVDGIHMKELGKDGKLGFLSECCRRELFEEVCYLIRKYRAVTIVASLSNQEYEAAVPQLVRDSFSVYGMLFNLTVMMNHQLAVANDYHEPIPIIMDTGNPHKRHVVDAHEFMVKRWQKKIGFLHVGGLTFEDDKVLNILQAADVIAWGTRRRASKLRFLPGLEPVEKLLTSDEAHHTEIPWKPEWLSEFGTQLAEQIAKGKGFDEPTDEEIKEQ
jgi:hypothetical protein